MSPLSDGVTRLWMLLSAMFFFYKGYPHAINTTRIQQRGYITSSFSILVVLVVCVSYEHV